MRKYILIHLFFNDVLLKKIFPCLAFFALIPAD